MDRQERFERFCVKIMSEEVIERKVAEDFLHRQIWIKEEWGVARLALLKMALHMLPSVARRVIKAIFFDELGEREAARKLKMNRAKLHRVKIEALRNLAESQFVKLALYPWVLKKEKTPGGSPCSSCIFAKK